MQIDIFVKSLKETQKRTFAIMVYKDIAVTYQMIFSLVIFFMICCICLCRSCARQFCSCCIEEQYEPEVMEARP